MALAGGIIAFLAVRLIFHGAVVFFFIPILFMGSLAIFATRAMEFVLRDGFNAGGDIIHLAFGAEVPGIMWFWDAVWIFAAGGDLSWWTVLLIGVLVFWLVNLRDDLYLDVSEYFHFNFGNRTPLWLLMLTLGVLSAVVETLPGFPGMLRLLPLAGLVFAALRFPRAVSGFVGKLHGLRGRKKKRSVESAAAAKKTSQEASAEVSRVKPESSLREPEQELRSSISEPQVSFLDIAEDDVSAAVGEPSDSEDPEEEVIEVTGEPEGFYDDDVGEESEEVFRAAGHEIAGTGPDGVDVSADPETHEEAVVQELAWPDDDVPSDVGTQDSGADAFSGSGDEDAGVQESFWTIVGGEDAGSQSEQMAHEEIAQRGEDQSSGHGRSAVVKSDSGSNGGGASRSDPVENESVLPAEGRDQALPAVTKVVTRGIPVLKRHGEMDKKAFNLPVERGRIEQAMYQLTGMANANLVRSIFMEVESFSPENREVLARSSKVAALAVRAFEQFGNDHAAGMDACREGMAKLRDQQMEQERATDRPAAGGSEAVREEVSLSGTHTSRSGGVSTDVEAAVDEVHRRLAATQIQRQEPIRVVRHTPQAPQGARVSLAGIARKTAVPARTAVPHPREPDPNMADEEFGLEHLVGADLAEIAVRRAVGRGVGPEKAEKRPSEPDQESSGKGEQVEVQDVAEAGHLVSDLEILKEIVPLSEMEVNSFLANMAVFANNRTVVSICREFVEKTREAKLKETDREVWNRLANGLWQMSHAGDDWRRHLSVLFGVIDCADSADPDKDMARRKVALIGAEPYRVKFDKACVDIVLLLEKEPDASVAMRDIDRVKAYLIRVVELFPDSVEHRSWSERLGVALENRERALRIDPTRRGEDEEQMAAISAGMAAMIEIRVSAETRHALQRFDVLCDAYESIESQISRAAIELGKDRERDPLASLQADIVARGLEAINELEARRAEMTKEIRDFLPVNLLNEPQDPVDFLLALKSRRKRMLYMALRQARGAGSDIVTAEKALSRSRSALVETEKERDSLKERLTNLARDEARRSWDQASGDCFANLEARIIASRGRSADEARDDKFPPMEVFKYVLEEEAGNKKFVRNDKNGDHRLFAIETGRSEKREMTVLFPVFGASLVWDLRKGADGQQTAPILAAGGYAQNSWDLRRIASGLAGVLRDIGATDLKFLLFGGKVLDEAKEILSSSLIGLGKNDQKTETRGIVVSREDLESGSSSVTAVSGFAARLAEILHPMPESQN
ncbi:MAG: hypothetical protein EPN75_08805 [Beijerinckiaceae bacterium]|nr:MAG: hypothetical protein EPN75_08805 [Beijerinckiaceae bacterium]